MACLVKPWWFKKLILETRIVYRKLNLIFSFACDFLRLSAVVDFALPESSMKHYMERLGLNQAWNAAANNHCLKLFTAECSQIPIKSHFSVSPKSYFNGHWEKMLAILAVIIQLLAIFRWLWGTHNRISWYETILGQLVFAFCCTFGWWLLGTFLCDLAEKNTTGTIFAKGGRL